MNRTDWLLLLIEEATQHDDSGKLTYYFRPSAYPVRVARLPTQLRVIGQCRSSTRRAALADSPGTFTPAEWLSLCEAADNRWLACGKKTKLTVDHVIPLVMGGANSIDNIQPLCRPCNSSKFTADTDYRFAGLPN